MFMKKDNIQNKTLKCLITFSIIILLIMWGSQILFLTLFYEKYQINNLNKVAYKLSKNIYDVEEIESIAYKNNICIKYISDNNVYTFNELSNNCILNNSRSVNNIVNNFINNNTTKEIIKVNNPINNTKSILYNLKIQDDKYIILNTNLEDVDSTTSVLKNQLIYITLIIIILSIIVSIILSKMLNKPIINITNEAKKLAKGNKELNIPESNIKEIDDLRDSLIYASKEINKTDELRRDLLANVSHDLKTPLTMIKAYAEMVRDLNKDNEKKRNENLNIIIEETDRLTLLVNDILNLSKLEANKENLDITEFDLVNLIENIIKKYNIIKETENYNFVLKLPEKALVKGDVNKISQVIYNLVNNAINYTGDDLTVIIEIIENKKTYTVNIIDSGKGIKKEELNIIWDKYYKNEKNHKRSKVGTGVGLSIVKNILDKHNFKYGVISKVGKGTKFYFEITKIS